jgi:cytochrome c-type biogenesis protein CcmE
MNIHHKRRLTWILVLMTTSSIAMGLILYALRQNINLFYTPSQLKEDHLKHKLKYFRLGGMVVKGSIKREGLKVKFQVSDLENSLEIEYVGILPDLFKEGQGVIARGSLQPSGLFKADQILAKHDENYMPPEIKHLGNSKANENKES